MIYGALTAVFFLGSVLALGLGATAESPKWLIAFTWTAVGCLVLTWKIYRRAPIPKLDSVDWAILAFLAWCGASLLWSADWRYGTHHLICMVSVCGIYWWVKNTQPGREFIGLLSACSIAGAMLLYLLLPKGYGGFGNPHFIAEFLILATILVFYASWKWGLAVAACVGVFLLGVPSGIPLLAVGTAAVGWVYLSHGWKYAAPLTVLGLLLLGVFQLDSLTDRAEIWVNTLPLIWSHPLVGHGLGSFDAVYDTYREFHFRFFENSLLSPSVYAGAAHNEILQIWTELGLIGLVLAGVVAWRLVQAAPKVTLWILFMVAALSLVEFPLHNTASVVVVAVAAGMGAREARVWDLRVIPRWRSVALPGVAVGLLAAGFLGVKSDMYMNAMKAWMPTDPILALRLNVNAYETYPLQAWPRRQVMLSLNSLLSRADGNEDLDVILKPDAADILYEIGKTAAPNDPNVLFARGSYLLRTGRWSESGEADQILSVMKGNASRLPATWVMEMAYAVFTQDMERAVVALERSAEFPANPYEPQLMSLAALMRGNR